jgi:hypothetical protein
LAAAVLAVASRSTWFGIEARCWAQDVPVIVALDQSIGGIVFANGKSGEFPLKLPQSGIVTVSLSNFPEDCVFQVIVTGFQDSATTSPGWVVTDRGKPLTFSFAAQGGKPGSVRLRLDQTLSTVNNGDWAAVRCTSTGPWHLLPYFDRQEKNVPRTYDGVPIVGQITYEVKFSFRPIPDAHEPNHRPGHNHKALFDRGLIKTVPVGRLIEAYLFNDYAAFLRGTKGNEDSRGGEDDVDLYHVPIEQPGTVKVVVSELPKNANLKIAIYHSQGWVDSKPGQTELSAEIPKPCDVFIELSKGSDNRPLVYSTQPYRLLVTTGSTRSHPEVSASTAGEKAVQELAAALAAGDAEAALKRIDSGQQRAYRAAFASDKALMSRMGRLLSTRKLVREKGRLAEYEVTEDGRTFTVVFELRGGAWVLASL